MTAPHWLDNCCVIIATTMCWQSCRLCYHCRSQQLTATLKSAFLEHVHRCSYRRLFPPPMDHVSQCSISVALSLAICRKRGGAPYQLATTVTLTNSWLCGLQKNVNKISTGVHNDLTVVNKTPTDVHNNLTVVNKTPTGAHNDITVINKTPTGVHNDLTVAYKTPTGVHNDLTDVNKTPTGVHNDITVVNKTPTGVHNDLTVVKRTPTGVHNEGLQSQLL